MGFHNSPVSGQETRIIFKNAHRNCVNVCKEKHFQIEARSTYDTEHFWLQHIIVKWHLVVLTSFTQALILVSCRIELRCRVQTSPLFISYALVLG